MDSEIEEKRKKIEMQLLTNFIDVAGTWLIVHDRFNFYCENKLSMSRYFIQVKCSMGLWFTVRCQKFLM